MIEIICKNCGCLFSYEKEDIKKDQDFENFFIYKMIFHCPQCKKEIILE